MKGKIVINPTTARSYEGILYGFYFEASCCSQVGDNILFCQPSSILWASAELICHVRGHVFARGHVCALKHCSAQSWI